MPLLICCVGLLVYFIGSVLYLVNKGAVKRTHGLGDMAAVLTLKPLITSPIWLIFAAGSPTGLIAEVIFTLLIVNEYKHLLIGPKAQNAARFLFILDCVRWGNNLFLSVFAFAGNFEAYGNRTDFERELLEWGMRLGLAFPFFYVIIALICVTVSSLRANNWTWDNKPKRKPKSEPAEIYLPDEPEQVEMIFEDEIEKPKCGDGELN